MKPEIEAKFLHVDPDDIRARLKKIGAECKQPMIAMRRVIYDNEVMNQKHAYLRVRDEGYKKTITYKQFDEMSLTGAKEIEFNIEDYSAAVALFEAIGVEAKSEQESRREVWMHGDVEVVIDEWPWIDPFIEIEAPTEEGVRATAKELGFAWSEASFGDVMTAYQSQYPNMLPEDKIYNLPAIRFNDPAPDMLRL